MKKGLIIFAALVLAGSAFWFWTAPDYIGTRAEAVTLIERGWIPSLIPASAYDVREKHSLDLNIGWGEFSFRNTDAESFRSSLISASAGMRPNERALGIIQRAAPSLEHFVFGDEEWGTEYLVRVDWKRLEAEFWMDTNPFREKSPNLPLEPTR